SATVASRSPLSAPTTAASETATTTAQTATAHASSSGSAKTRSTAGAGPTGYPSGTLGTGSTLSKTTSRAAQPHLRHVRPLLHIVLSGLQSTAEASAYQEGFV